MSHNQQQHTVRYRPSRTVRSQRRRRRRANAVVIDSLNIRGLQGGVQGGKVDDIRRAMLDEGVYAMAVQELKVRGGQEEVYDDGAMLLTVGMAAPDAATGRFRGGAGLFLSARAVKDWQRGGSLCRRYGERIIAVSLLATRPRTRRLHRIWLVSGYAPDSSYPEAEFEAYLRNLSVCLVEAPRMHTVLVGCDANTRLGTCCPGDPSRILGCFGLASRGTTALQRRRSVQHRRLLHNHSLCSAATFFQASDRGSHATFVPPTGRRYQLDHVFVRQAQLQRCARVYVTSTSPVNTDHRRLRTVLRDAAYRRQRPPRQRPQLDSLLDGDEEEFQRFVRRVESEVEQAGGRPDLGRFRQIVKGALNSLPRKRSVRDDDWYEEAKVMLDPLRHAAIQARAMVAAGRVVGRRRRVLRARAKRAWAIYRAAKVSAKRRWYSTLIDKINDGGPYRLARASSKEAWDMVRLVAQDKPRLRRPGNFRLRHPENGRLCESDAETADVLEAHLEALHGGDSPFDQAEVEQLRQRPIQWHLANAPTMDEFARAVGRLQNGKAPGFDGIPAEAYKALTTSETVSRLIFGYLTSMWATGSYTGEHPDPDDDSMGSGVRRCPCEHGGPCPGLEATDDGGVCYEEWLHAVLVSLPKKPHADRPSQRRSICLLNVLSKVMTSIMAERITRWLETNAPECFNGFRRGRGTRDAIWNVVEILRQRRREGLITWAAAVDIAVAFDSISREALWAIMLRFGFPPHFVNVLRRLHDGAHLNFRVGRQRRRVANTRGVRTGDSAGPQLFLLGMVAIFERLRDVLGDEAEGLVFTTTRYMDARDERNEQLDSSGFADDVISLSPSRRGLRRWLVAFRAVTKALTGMTVHTATTRGGGSKTVATMFPPPGSSWEQFDTTDMALEDGAYVPFTTEVKYLGVWIDITLDDDIACDARIAAATGARSAVRRVLLARELEPRAKGKVIKATVLAVLLYGSEVWRLSSMQMRKLRTFWNQTCRAALNISMWRMREEHIHTDTVYSHLGVRSVEFYIRQRRLAWAGDMAVMPLSRVPRQLLSAVHLEPSLRQAHAFGDIYYPSHGDEISAAEEVLCSNGRRQASASQRVESNEQNQSCAVAVSASEDGGAAATQGPSPPAAQQAACPAPACADGVASGNEHPGDNGWQARPLAVGYATSAVRCAVTRRYIPRGTLVFTRVAARNRRQRVSPTGLLGELARAEDSVLDRVLAAGVTGIDELRPGHAETVQAAISRESVLLVRRVLNPPPIPLPEAAPWECPRCHYTCARLSTARRHHGRNDCLEAMGRATSALHRSWFRQVRRTRDERRQRLRVMRQGERRGTWQSVNLREDLRGHIEDPSCRRRCACSRRSRMCDRCFFIAWMTLAQGESWLRVVYGEGSGSGAQDGDVQHIARRRASRRPPPAEAWEP